MPPLQLVEGRGLKTSEKFLQGGGGRYFYFGGGGVTLLGVGSCNFEVKIKTA